jgi:hypothetical protein
MKLHLLDFNAEIEREDISKQYFGYIEELLLADVECTQG